MKIATRYASAALLVIGACGLGFAAAGWADGAATQKIRMIKVSSKRYEFIPDTLTLKKGETVDIELTSEDIVMGFSVPDMTRRATLAPGHVIHLQLTPQKAGTFGFLCDVFCGSGHEDMNGTIIVIE